MARTRCNLCGEWIGQRQEIIRVITERVRKKKGDCQDPLRWSDTLDWTEAFIAHADCTRAEIEARDAQPLIPCEGEMHGLFDQEEESERHLAIVRGGKP